MYFVTFEDELLRKKNNPKSFLVAQHVKRLFRMDYDTKNIIYISEKKEKVMVQFDDIYAYNLFENHKEKSIVKQWPWRLDFVLSQSATEEVKAKGQQSIYFDNKDKCDRWCTALNFILDPSPIGYRASMRRRTTKKQVSFYEPAAIRPSHKNVMIDENKIEEAKEEVKVVAMDPEVLQNKFDEQYSDCKQMGEEEAQ